MKEKKKAEAEIARLIQEVKTLEQNIGAFQRQAHRAPAEIYGVVRKALVEFDFLDGEDKHQILKSVIPRIEVEGQKLKCFIVLGALRALDTVEDESCSFEVNGWLDWD